MRIVDIIYLTVEERVRKIVAEIFKVEEGKITRATRFTEDLFAKSVNIIEMIALMEDEFKVEISFAKARSNATVGEAIDYIETLLKLK